MAKGRARKAGRQPGKRRVRAPKPSVSLCDWRNVELTDGDRLAAKTASEATGMGEDAEEAYLSLLQSTLISRIAEKSVVRVPAGLVRERALSMAHALERRVQASGVTIDEYLAENETTKDQVVAEFELPARRQLEERAVLLELARAEGLIATDAEFAAEVERLGQRYPVSPGEIAGILAATGEASRLREDIAVSKAAHAVRSHMEDVEAARP